MNIARARAPLEDPIMAGFINCFRRSTHKLTLAQGSFGVCSQRRVITLNGCYQHLNSRDELRVRHYVGILKPLIPEPLPDSNIAIREYWKTISGDGQSVMEQLN
jgi:hypothetical protein